MITIDALQKAQRLYMAAWNSYLGLEREHEDGLARHEEVKAARERAQKLEAEYNRMWLDYQAQGKAR